MCDEDGSIPIRISYIINLGQRLKMCRIYHHPFLRLCFISKQMDVSSITSDWCFFMNRSMLHISFQLWSQGRLKVCASRKETWQSMLWAICGNRFFARLAHLINYMYQAMSSGRERDGTMNADARGLLILKVVKGEWSSK